MATPLDDDSYISLQSYTRDGRAIDTAVWAAPLDGKLVVFTLRDSMKVKRIRRNPKVKVAKCGVAGKILGPWHDGTCAIVSDEQHEARAYEALTAKYGWQMKLGTLMRSVFGGLEKRVILEITLDR